MPMNILDKSSYSRRLSLPRRTRIDTVNDELLCIIECNDYKLTCYIIVYTGDLGGGVNKENTDSLLPYLI